MEGSTREGRGRGESREREVLLFILCSGSPSRGRRERIGLLPLDWRVGAHLACFLTEAQHAQSLLCLGWSEVYGIAEFPRSHWWRRRRGRRQGSWHGIASSSSPPRSRPYPVENCTALCHLCAFPHCPAFVCSKPTPGRCSPSSAIQSIRFQALCSHWATSLAPSNWRLSRSP